MSNLYNRSYVLSIIEQKVTYSRESTPPPVKQAFVSAWDDILNIPDLEDGILNYGDLEDGILNTEDPQPESTPPVKEVQQTKTISGGNSVAITKLHIEADISSSDKEGEAAKCTIRVYNASKDTRAKLERKNAYVILQAGYENDIGIVFTGTVLKAYTIKQGNNVVTELLCQDSNIQLKTSRVSYSWPPNTSYATIINDVAKEMQKQGVSIGLVNTDEPNLPSLPSPKDTIAKGGYTFQGMATQLLDKLCSQFKYSYYITLNELYIHPKYFKNFTVQYDMPLDIIKSIRPENDTSDDVPSIEKPVEFKLVTFLDHRIKIGQLIRISEGDYKGTYKVKEVSTNLSYQGGDWDSTLKLEATS